MTGFINRYNESEAADKAARAADCPVPALQEGIITFAYGCDTGLMHTESNKKAIELALEAGANKGAILRGTRDNTRMFPGMYENAIQDIYLSDDVVERALNPRWENGVIVSNPAPGFSHIWSEGRFYISQEAYNEALTIIIEKRNEKKQKEEHELELKFAQARETGERVEVNRIALHEEDTPLRDDGEGDIVICVEYANPDGTVSTEYHHTY